MSDAELLLRDGKYPEARLILRAALDAQPASLLALDTLGSLAEVSPPDEPELFARLALVANENPALWWRQLSYALFFANEQLTAAILSAPYVIEDERRRAAMGALLLELGRTAEGERLLHSAGGPLARYHLAMYAASRHRHARARAHLYQLGTHSLGSIGSAFLELERGATASARRRMQSRPVAPSARSEWMLLRICLAIVEGRRADAERAAGDLGNPPYEADPSAMVRSASLLGIACLARLSQQSFTRSDGSQQTDQRMESPGGRGRQ